MEESLHQPSGRAYKYHIAKSSVHNSLLALIVEGSKVGFIMYECQSKPTVFLLFNRNKQNFLLWF